MSLEQVGNRSNFASRFQLLGKTSMRAPSTAYFQRYVKSVGNVMSARSSGSFMLPRGDVG
jgi:hypothetical protein